MTLIVLYVFANIISTYTIFRLMRVLLGQPSVTRPIYYLAYSSFYLADMIFFLFIRLDYLLIFGKLLLLALLTLIYAGTIKRKLIAAVMVYLFLAATETVIVFFTGHEGYSFLRPFYFDSMMGIICNTMIQFMSVLLIEHFYKVWHSRELSSVYFLCILFVPISSIEIVSFILNNDYVLTDNTVVILILILCINLFVFYLYDSLLKTAEYKKELHLINAENTYLKKNTELIQVLQKSIDNFRHDVKNHIIALSGLLKAGQNAEAALYLEKLIGDNTWNDNILTGRAAIDTFLNFKIQEAKQHGVSIDINIAIPVEMNIDDFDLIIILSNLIENAIDAVRTLPAEDKIITLTIRYDRNRLIIKSTNKSSKPLIFNNDGEIRSTKDTSSKHGFGLAKIKKVVAKYGGDASFTMNDGLVFDAFIILLISKKHSIIL